MTTTGMTQAELGRFDSPFCLWEEISLEGLGYEHGSMATIRGMIPKRLRNEWEHTFREVPGESEEQRQQRGDEERYQLIPYLVPKVVLVRDGEEQVYDLSSVEEVRRLDLEVDGQVLNLAMRELWLRAEDKILIAQAKWHQERLAVLRPVGEG